jgi:positive regulator of sigma E activity
VVLAIVGYLIGAKLSLGEGAALLLALGGLLLAFLLIFFYSKLVVSRRVDIEIVSIVQEKEQEE